MTCMICMICMICTICMICMIYDLYDLYDLPHDAGREPYDLNDLTRVSWVGSVPCTQILRSIP